MEYNRQETIICWNINTVRNSYNQANLQSLVDLERPAVICLQETRHFVDKDNKPTFVLNGYEPHHQPPYLVGDGGMRRGLITFVRFGIHCDVVSNPSGVSDRDCLITRIRLNKTPLDICNVYRPSDISDYTISKLFNKDKSVIVCGDLNGHHPLWGNSDTVADAYGSFLFNDLVNNVNITLISDSRPTFGRGNTTIDLVMSSANIAARVDLDVLVKYKDTKDHYPLVISFDPNYSKRDDVPSNTRWDLIISMLIGPSSRVVHFHTY